MNAWVPETGVDFHWGDVFACEPDWSWSVENLPDLDLWYVAAGAGWIDDGERRMPIGAGDCLILRPGGSYASGHDPALPLSLVCIHFDLVGSDGRVLGAADIGARAFVRRMSVGAFFRELVMRAIHAHHDGSRERAAAWLQATLLEVAREDAGRFPPGQAGRQARGIQIICERIRRQPGRPVRIDQLAAELSVSPEHFCRVFRRLHGMSPRAFVTRARLEGAQALLLTSSYSVARIAELNGYQSPSHFTRHFKAVVGCSPKQFRLGEHMPAAARARQVPARA